MRPSFRYIWQQPAYTSAWVEIEDLSGEKNKLQDIMSGDAARMQKEAEQASIRQLDPCPIPDRNETMDEMSMREFHLLL